MASANPPAPRPAQPGAQDAAQAPARSTDHPDHPAAETARPDSAEPASGAPVITDYASL